MQETSFEPKLLDDPRLDQRDACGVGFIVNIKGQPSHEVVTEGLEILKRLDHRGGRAADGRTSDGSGLQVQIPRAFFEKKAAQAGIRLPEEYAVAMIFLPREIDEFAFWRRQIVASAEKEGIDCLWAREVPVDSSVLGPVAKADEPITFQFFFRDVKDEAATFAWRLFMLRKNLEAIGRERYGIKQYRFYVCSLSTATICYKGLVLAEDFANYFLDLQDRFFQSAISMVHQRFSTNTLPSWPLAQPFRILCHNGEINTLRGNINAMHARSQILSRAGLDEDLNRMGPICVPGGSDSAMLDNVVEFMLHSGRSLAEILTMLVPEPWEQHEEMSQELRDYYEYQSYRMEPWDGPAFLGFTDGVRVGALLDRNGLRPGRYWVTCDGHVIMASEAGVLDRRPEEIVRKGRLSPGRIFMVDTEEGSIIPDHTIKRQLATQRPFGQWLATQRLRLEDLPEAERGNATDGARLTKAMKAFGYSREDLRMIIAPMANEGKEPLGSMGTDTPLAVLSHKRPLLYDYFKQLFAQVTNPPIDAIREELITSMSTHLGAEGNLFEDGPDHCRMIRLDHPVLSNDDLGRLLAQSHLPAKRISSCYRRGRISLAEAVARLTESVAGKVAEGLAIVVLSDRDIDEDSVAIPALLATSAVHHDLIRRGLRTRCSLIVESGEPREVHHFALLFGFGAAAVNPYLVYETLDLGGTAFSPKADRAARQKNFRKAIEAGVLKVMSKMGISTLHSYRGAQIFEALGLRQDFVDRYFTWTPTRIEGVGIDDFEDDILWRHDQAYRNRAQYSDLPEGGQYHWRRNGELHLHSPAMIASLQKATRINSREEFKRFCATLDQTGENVLNLRGLLAIKKGQTAIPLDEVEPATSIVRRFATGAMSFGSISLETHETIAVAMNRMGGKSNSGEGGEDAARSVPFANGDSRRSAIKQVASGRFGVTSHYLSTADELQIKMAQGAKPGEGGQLPGDKVDETIGRVRHSTPGITLISPPPHHDIYSIEDLAQLIYDLKNANRGARINVKLVSEVGVGTIAAGVAKAKAEAILISGHEGGTGASPLSSIKHAGLPWELGLAETHRMLVANQLRSRVTLQVDGQLRTPRDIAIACLLGAEEWGVGTGALVVLGCIMMRKCHLNTCPVGIATQDPELRKKFDGQPEHLINYFFLLAEGLREIMAELGFRRIEEMVGRSDLLERRSDIQNARLAAIDLSALIGPVAGNCCRSESQDFGLDGVLDIRELIPAAARALEGRGSVTFETAIRNTDRSVGTMLSAEVSKRFGEAGLVGHRIHLNFRGSGGQSFMAFGARGLHVTLEGEVNDYCGKGLSGAEVAVRPAESFLAETNVICGNVTLYGATAGSLFVRGLAGERFAVRNSGAHAVVEGLGDHGCEYMTGGSVVVLGAIGRNFGAGMSGGIAYLYSRDRQSLKNVNQEMLQRLPELEEDDIEFLGDQLERHWELTGSPLARRILDHWTQEVKNFHGFAPPIYRDMMRKDGSRILQRRARRIAAHNELFIEQGGYHG